MIVLYLGAVFTGVALSTIMKTGDVRNTVRSRSRWRGFIPQECIREGLGAAFLKSDQEEPVLLAWLYHKNVTGEEPSPLAWLCHNNMMGRRVSFVKAFKGSPAA